MDGLRIVESEKLGIFREVWSDILHPVPLINVNVVLVNMDTHNLTIGSGGIENPHAMTLEVNGGQHEAFSTAFQPLVLVLHALGFFDIARQEVSARSFGLFLRRHFVVYNELDYFSVVI